MACCWNEESIETQGGGQHSGAAALGLGCVLEETLEGVLKHRLPGPSPRVSRSVGLGWGQEISV